MVKKYRRFLPSLNKIIKIKTDIYHNSDINNIDNTILKSLFNKYGSDKSENYAVIYTKLLEKYKNLEIRLLEIGLGTNNPLLISTMGNNGVYKCGSSLRAFRDYLQNAHIFGADIDKECLFTEEKINTTFVDQLDMDTFTDLHKTFGNKKYDFIIDDGLHSITANLNTLLFAINHINDNRTIVIEDIDIKKIEGYYVIDNIIKNNYINLKTQFITYNNKKGFIYVLFS